MAILCLQCVSHTHHFSLSISVIARTIGNLERLHLMQVSWSAFAGSVSSTVFSVPHLVL
jgi:hypothetical protein